MRRVLLPLVALMSLVGAAPASRPLRLEALQPLPQTRTLPWESPPKRFSEADRGSGGDALTLGFSDAPGVATVEWKKGHLKLYPLRAELITTDPLRIDHPETLAAVEDRSRTPGRYALPWNGASGRGRLVRTGPKGALLQDEVQDARILEDGSAVVLREPTRGDFELV
jgi:hypothetical protein